MAFGLIFSRIYESWPRARTRFPTVPLELAIPGNGKRHPGSNWVASMIDIGSIQLSGGGSTASVYHWPNEDYLHCLRV